MDPVVSFVFCARKRVASLDYVAKCCQLCGTSKHVVDTLVASLSSGTLQRPFWDAAAVLSRRGGDGALPTAFAQQVWTDTDRAADGLLVARDWRAWLVAREHVVEAIDELERHIAPTPAWQEPSAILIRASSAPPASAATPATPGEAQSPAGSTPSAHDIAARLTDNARSVLEALLESGATSRTAAVIRADIEDKSGVKGNSLRRALKTLRDSPEPCTDSAGSVAGGIWLTPFGLSVAQVIADEESPQSARNDARTDSKPARKDRASLRDS
jgi:hypothetical protein